MRSSIKKCLNIGWLIERCRFNIRERVFAEEWMKNNRHSRVSGGTDLLQSLFSRAPMNVRNFLSWRRPRLYLIARDRFVAATVIQWLGTNVGFSFLTETLEKLGYEIVPTKEAEKRDDYYNPWKQARDASYWHNFSVDTSKNYYSTTFSKISPHFVTPLSKKRKHLLRNKSGEYCQKICIRCGWEPRSDLQHQSEPECFANFQHHIAAKTEKTTKV